MTTALRLMFAAMCGLLAAQLAVFVFAIVALNGGVFVSLWFALVPGALAALVGYGLAWRKGWFT